MSDDEFEQWQKKAFKTLVTVAIISVLGGNAGSVLNYTRPEVRHDAWTASQDKHAMDVMKAEIIGRFIRNEGYIDTIRDDAHKALDNDSRCDERAKQIRRELEYHREFDH